MKTPTWESSAGALAELLNGSGRTLLWMVDLYTLSNGNTVLARWTSSDRDINVNSNAYQCDPLIERDSVRWMTGVEVDSLSVTITPSQTGTLIGTTPLLQYAVKNGFDGCRLKMERGYSSTLGGNIVGTLLMFDGRVSEQSITRNSIELTIKSDLELMDQQLPKNLYQSSCMNTMYDSACGLTRTEHLSVSSGSSNSTRTAFPINLPLASQNYFALGTVEFITGACIGVRRSIKSSTSNLITLMAALPAPVAIGDQIKLVRGCDRTQATCNALGNLIHFRGCPYIPKPETILSGT